MEKVIVSVYWPDDWKKIELNPSDWQKIKRGESFSDLGNGYNYEGVKFNDFWEFNEEFKGSCKVTYDDGGIGFEGLIDECQIELL
jgi:hypothetical protein